MGKKKSILPDRWTHYLPLGKRIPGTRFIAFKVPLKESFEWRLPPNERFSPLDLVNQVREQQEELGLIIDLTFTTRYYDPKELPATLQYCKIFTVGQEVPNSKTFVQFKKVVEKFLKENQHNDKLIGVHCTHGLNRTGYLVCRYLIDVEGMDPNRAIELFNRCRGHSMERKNYIEDLQRRAGGRNPSAVLEHDWMEGHVSPAQNSAVQVVDYRPQKLQPFLLEAPRHFPCQRSSDGQNPKRAVHTSCRRSHPNPNLITCYDHSQSVCGPWYPPTADVSSPRWDHTVRPHQRLLSSPYQQHPLQVYEGPDFPGQNPQYHHHHGRYKIDRRPNQNYY